jgi:ribonuclease BN (tRNA processing enzyme)
MKLTVLGGSAASLNAGQGSSGYLVTHLETTIVLDPGPNTFLELRKHTDYRVLSGIVISHLHLDHILDIFALKNALSYNPIKPQGPIPLFLPPEGEAYLRAIGDPIGKMEGGEDFFSDFVLREYDPAQTLTVGDLSIDFSPTVHALPTWAMRITGQGESRQLVYTADAGPTSDLASFVQGAHVLLAEATYGIDPAREEDGTDRIHMTVGETTRLAVEANARTLVLTHTFQEKSPEDYVAEARNSFEGTVLLAKPGLEVGWDQK